MNQLYCLWTPYAGSWERLCACPLISKFISMFDKEKWYNFVVNNCWKRLHFATHNAYFFWRKRLANHNRPMVQSFLMQWHTFWVESVSEYHLSTGMESQYISVPRTVWLNTLKCLEAAKCNWKYAIHRMLMRIHVVLYVELLCHNPFWTQKMECTILKSYDSICDLFFCSVV